MPLPKRTNPYYVAQDILSRRDHSEFEVRTKMKRKHFSTVDIDNVIAKLKKLDLINDKKFALMFVENTLLFKAVGPKSLSYKLKQKGIKQSLIEEALAAAYTPGREVELARQAAASWQRAHPNQQDHQRRLTRYLLSRGFSFSTINAVYNSDQPLDDSE